MAIVSFYLRWVGTRATISFADNFLRLCPPPPLRILPVSSENCLWVWYKEPHVIDSGLPSIAQQWLPYLLCHARPPKVLVPFLLEHPPPRPTEAQEPLAKSALSPQRTCGPTHGHMGGHPLTRDTWTGWPQYCLPKSPAGAA